jgi:hypothetical protein
VMHRALLHSLAQDTLKLRTVTEKEPTESTKGTSTAWLMADDSKVSKALRRMQIGLYLHVHHGIQVNSASRVVDESGLAECLDWRPDTVVARDARASTLPQRQSNYRAHSTA